MTWIKQFVWFFSNPEVFGKELAGWDDETAEGLAGCMIYRRRSWKGILPTNHLAQCAASHQVTQTVHCNSLLSLLAQSVKVNWTYYFCKNCLQMWHLLIAV